MAGALGQGCFEAGCSALHGEAPAGAPGTPGVSLLDLPVRWAGKVRINEEPSAPPPSIYLTFLGKRSSVRLLAHVPKEGTLRTRNRGRNAQLSTFVEQTTQESTRQPSQRGRGGGSIAGRGQEGHSPAWQAALTPPSLCTALAQLFGRCSRGPITTKFGPSPSPGFPHPHGAW